jgi:hypothetical protein
MRTRNSSQIETQKTENITNPRSTTAALTCGVLGVLAAVWVYWLVVPGIILGLAAVVLGWRARRCPPSEGASVAIALGIVAILLVPSVIAVVGMEADYARDCALNPTDPDC